VITFRADLKIWVAAQPVDFRKSIHTLSALVNDALRANPYICVGRKYVAAQSR
jgi:transposase